MVKDPIDQFSTGARKLLSENDPSVAVLGPDKMIEIMVNCSQFEWGDEEQQQEAHDRIRARGPSRGPGM